MISSRLIPWNLGSQAAGRFPKLAEIAAICLSIPVNSVAAERSFSIYGAILTDRRRSIKEMNLPVYNMHYQNPETL